MRTEAVASPLTVWMGSARYTFAPGRDITVGRDDRADIPLENPEESRWASRIHMLLRFDGSHWVAIDTSRNGIFVGNRRVSTVSIRDGQTITLADPDRGPRLHFRISASRPSPPPPATAGPVPPPAQRSWRSSLRTPKGAPPPMQPGVRPPSQLPTRPFQAPAAAAYGEPAVAAPRPTQPESSSQASTDPIPIPQAEAPKTEQTTPVPVAAPKGKPADPPPQPQPEARPTTTSRSEGLRVQQLSIDVDGRQVLSEVTFTARPGTVTAVIDPAGTGSTALVDALSGAIPPSAGQVVLDGNDVGGLDAASTVSRIGVVPRRDVVHRQLTVEQAVRYAAELRLPPGTSADERRHVVNQVLAELELNARRTVQIRELPAELRKRASIAAELVTAPALLVLDEPTAGLDPSGQRHLMAGLRRLADTGRVVVVATRSDAHRELCDQVLTLTEHGTVADDAGRDVAARRGSAPGPRQPAPPAGQRERAARPRVWRQFAVAVRRQAWLVVGDQRYFIFLVILPILFAGLSLIVPGHTGFGKANPYGDSPDEAVELLTLLSLGAVVMGTALTIRDLVGERTVFARERFLGLSPSAYLGAKICVYSVIAMVQTAIMTIAAVVGKGAPTADGLVFGDSSVELYLSVAALAIVSAIIALACASLLHYRDQLLPVAVLIVLLSLVFCGGAFPVAGRSGLNVVSWFIPARWGFAASASSVNLDQIDVLATRDNLWMHSPDSWLQDMAMLTAMALAGIALLRWRLRAPARNRHALSSPPPDERQERPA